MILCPQCVVVELRPRVLAARPRDPGKAVLAIGCAAGLRAAGGSTTDGSWVTGGGRVASLIPIVVGGANQHRATRFAAIVACFMAILTRASLPQAAPFRPLDDDGW